MTEEWGEREVLEKLTLEWMELDVEEVEEALEWLGIWWMLRMEETDDEVDLRPRRPPVPDEWR